MAKAKAAPPPAPDEVRELREEIASLKDHIRLLVDAIDEVREELGWLTRNGLPLREPLPPIPVLKQMAVDPCADDWGEHRRRSPDLLGHLDRQFQVTLSVDFRHVCMGMPQADRGCFDAVEFIQLGGP